MSKNAEGNGPQPDLSAEPASEEAAREVATKIYARVRGLMPWEPKKVSLTVEGVNRVRNKTGKITNEYDFERVFKPNNSNEDAFKTIVIPMISNVLKGYNAVLIAYGQTGSVFFFFLNIFNKKYVYYFFFFLLPLIPPFFLTPFFIPLVHFLPSPPPLFFFKNKIKKMDLGSGKTFSMLGKPKLGVAGLLPRMLAYMVEQKSVASVELSAVEAFGHHVAKIELFDLYDADNQTPSWAEKKETPIYKGNKVYAHAASHFAPTGKNPESSRGHVTFVAKIKQVRSKHETMVSYFVMVDCAGSEGETAFTPEFKAMVDQQTLMARRLEAGTINTGLSQLQVVFNQLKQKGELSKAIGNGLRRVLHPYINTRTYLSVLFTLSPSINNAKATESTLKFAVTAGMVKVKPVAMKGKVNWECWSTNCEVMWKDKKKVIEDNNETIADLERQIARTKEAIERAKSGLPVKPKKQLKVKVEEVEKSYDTGGLVQDNVGSPRTQPVQMDDQVATALMEVLDDSIMDLMNELDEEFRDELQKEKELEKKQEQERAKHEQQLSQMGVQRRGRHRTQTVEENAEAMKIAIDVYNEHSRMASKINFAKKNVEKQFKQTEEEYKKLKAFHEQIKEEKEMEKLDKTQLASHAVDLNILLREQETVTDGLKQSKQIMVDYLKEDGREALIKWLQMRDLI
ncbi:hypothetical protein RFI_19552 [Reticulomyxa filosa]|uniref:Kinesin motor domain-containing protein n=1 Tax=Reticulomyxa filosa TaxID=46433 RepID=X6MXG0_RETFI|nr:hypothetical protein RFI_19552 [Reticulomyxa filosa]|eukprot:ETO17765.1 hypothetical protein RFI_19552 [Reticulomyxa filosa]